MKYLIAILFFFQIWNDSYGQEKEATLLFIDNTTLKGIAEIKRNKIYFRFTKDDEKSEWGHDFAKGVTFSGYGFSERYEYVKPDKYSEPILMEVIEEGDVNLYRKNHIETTYTTTPTTEKAIMSMPTGFTTQSLSTAYYVKRENEEYATDISFSFKTRSLKYFADCEIIIKKIKDKTFNSKSIPEIVTYYNNYCYTEEEND